MTFFRRLPGFKPPAHGSGRPSDSRCRGDAMRPLVPGTARLASAAESRSASFWEQDRSASEPFRCRQSGRRPPPPCVKANAITTPPWNGLSAGPPTPGTVTPVPSRTRNGWRGWSSPCCSPRHSSTRCDSGLGRLSGARRLGSSRTIIRERAHRCGSGPPPWAMQSGGHRCTT